MIVVGGYTTHDPLGQKISHKDASWFKLGLDRVTAPWAFCKGEPFKTIASLEFLGTMVSIMVFLNDHECDGRYNQCGAISVGA